MAVGVAAGLAVHVVGLVVAFAGAGLRGRVVGLALMAGGALVTVAVAPPEPSWPAAVAMALTLGPLLVVAVVLRRRLEDSAGRDGITLDDDPR